MRTKRKNKKTKSDKITISKQSGERGFGGLGKIIAIFFGVVSGISMGGFMGAIIGTGQGTFLLWTLTILGAVIGFVVVYYFWKFIFIGVGKIIANFFD